jgi:phosphoribosylamine--glycine ligase
MANKIEDLEIDFSFKKNNVDELFFNLSENPENFKNKDGYYCFHAGTKETPEGIVTNGGRVLGITAKGDTLAEARAKAYEATDWVDFDNKYMRHDIGKAIDEIK